MDSFPLQNELVDAVIGFANADLNHPDEVRDYFSGSWEPDTIPKLRTCRRIQSDVIEQLLNFSSQFHDRDCYAAMRGLDWLPGRRVDGEYTPGSYRRVDQGIRMEGFLRIEKVPVMGGHKEQIVWEWRISDASLRAICGLAMATIIQEDLHSRVGECKRDGCSNFFLDRKSRGTHREYCGSDECEKARNRLAVDKSRNTSKKRRGAQ